MIIPPLKIQGKKTKIVDVIMDNATQIKMVHDNIDTWVEPFMGSGAVCFNVPDWIKHVYCYDINPHIIAFYKAIQNREITPFSIKFCFDYYGDNLCNEFYLRIRDQFNEEHNLIDFLFLTRTCFNGVMRFNSKGKFNVPYCKVDKRLSERVINEIIESIRQLQMLFIEKDYHFEVLDYKESIERAPENSIIYCDPPYAGLNTDYYSTWTANEEQVLHDMLMMKENAIVSSWYDNGKVHNDNIEKIWGDGWNVQEIPHKYMVAPKGENRRQISEALLIKK